MAIETCSLLANDNYSFIDTNLQNYFTLRKLQKGFAAFGIEKGRCQQVALITGCIAATILTAACAGCSAYGSYEMFKISLQFLLSSQLPPADIAHAAEWSAQVIMYLYFYLRKGQELKNEGEFSIVEKTSKNLAAEYNISSFENSPLIYMAEFEEILRQYRHSCFLYKDPISLKVKSTNITKLAYPQNEENEALQSLNDISEICQNLISELNQTLSKKRYFQRTWTALKAIYREHGKISLLSSLCVGFGVPAILSVQGLLSFFGSNLLAYDLVKNDESYSAIGHLGEWPINGVAFLYFSFVINHWATTSYGDYHLAKRVINCHLQKLQNHPHYSIFKKVSNEYLSEVSGGTMLRVKRAFDANI